MPLSLQELFCTNHPYKLSEDEIHNGKLISKFSTKAFQGRQSKMPDFKARILRATVKVKGKTYQYFRVFIPKELSDELNMEQGQVWHFQLGDKPE